MSRSSGLVAGQFDIIHTSNADEISECENNPDFVLLQANDYGETGYNMVNVAAGANPVLATTRGMDEPVPMDPLGINADNPRNDAPVFPVVTGKRHLSQIWCFDGDCQG